MGLFESEAFLEGLWGGIFEVIALGIVGFWVNVVYHRVQVRKKQRQMLVDDLDRFSTALYPPRKLYQALLDRPEIIAYIQDEQERDLYKMNLLNQYLGELTQCAGQFRALQVQLIPLFGYHIKLFAYYMAIWRYIRQVRKRMEQKQTLYFHHETPSSSDAFYRLLDQFRYQIQITPSIKHKATLLSIPPDIQIKIQEEADELYHTYFEPNPPEAQSSSSELERSDDD